MTNDFKILIVEDNRTSLVFMEMLVRQIANCRALSYASPRDLMGDLDRIDFDIALVDYQMPDMNGVEVIDAIRANSALADTSNRHGHGGP